MSFRSVAVVHDIDTVPLTVTPVVKFIRDGAVRTVSLDAVALNAGESKLVDLSEAQKERFLPADLHQASIALSPENDRGDIVAELFNFDGRTGGYVVGPTFTSYPMRDTASVWRTDGSFQTAAVIENVAAQDDTVTLKAFSSQGAYKKSYPLAAGGILKISFKELQKNAVPDDNGHFLAGTSGVVQFLGSRIRSQLSVDKIIYSANQSDYVGDRRSSAIS